MKTQKQKLSLILPCYKEGKHIYKNMKILQKYLLENFLENDFELICINDGSPDNTLSQLMKVQKEIPEIQIVSYQENKGKGKAIMKGLEVCDGDIIALYDSDLDITLASLKSQILFLQEKNDYQIVIGSKNLEGSKRDVPLKRKILSGVNMQINSILFSLPVKDTQVGLKTFRKEIKNIFLEKVSTFGYAFDVDFLYHVSSAGYKIAEMPVELSINDENSGVNLLTMLMFLRDIFTLYNTTAYTLEKKRIRIQTRIRLMGIRCIVFPLEKFLGIFISIYSYIQKQKNLITENIS